jgi:hypothetical protein
MPTWRRTLSLKPRLGFGHPETRSAASPRRKRAGLRDGQSQNFTLSPPFLAFQRSIGLAQPDCEKTATANHNSSCACTPALFVSRHKPEHWKQFKHLLQSEHLLQLVQSSQFSPACGQSLARRRLQVQILSALSLRGIEVRTVDLNIQLTQLTQLRQPTQLTQLTLP